MVWDNQEGVDPRILLTIHCAGTSLSLLGAIWSGYYFVKIGGFQNTSLKLIMLVILSDLVYAISNIMAIFDGSGPELKPICYIDAFTRTCAYTLTLFFATCLAIFCYKSVKNDENFDADRYLWKCVIIGVVLCIWLTAAPTFVKNIKYANGDICCDIIVEKPSDLATFFLSILHGALPIILFILVSAGAYIATLITVRKLPKESGDLKASLNRLFLYPAVLFFISVPGLTELYTINFTISKEEDFPLMQLAHLLFTRCSGFFNALVYGMQMKSYYLKNQRGIGSNDNDLSQYIGDDEIPPGEKHSNSS